jgi:hypothetical protein
MRLVVPRTTFRLALTVVLAVVVASIGLCVIDHHAGDVDVCLMLLAAGVATLPVVILRRSSPAVAGPVASRTRLLPYPSPAPPI